MEIQHSSDEQKGLFFIKEQDKILAEMAYVMAGKKTLIIDHTDVDPSLKGQGIGRKLLDELVRFAREHEYKVLPLCPFAKSVFTKDESIRDVLV